MTRRAGPEDLAHLLDLCREFCAVDGHAFDEPTYRSALLPLLTDDDHGFVLVGDGAYAVVTWGWSLESRGRDALLDEIYVRERGIGIGSALLGIAVATARSAGARRVFLETERGNEAARRFYAGAGFVTEDSVWMSLDLDGDTGDPPTPRREDPQPTPVDGDLVADVEESTGGSRHEPGDGVPPA